MPHIPIYLQVLVESTPLGDAKAAHKRVHDNLAGVLDATVGAKHGNESAGFIALVEAELSEEGKAIAQKHAVKLAAAHDESAKQCGMECEGCYNESLGLPLDSDQDGGANPDTPNDDPMQQGDEQSAHSSHKGEKPMTEEEMIAALKAKGHTITPPKPVEEEVAELRRQIEEQDAKIKALSEGATGQPQRKTEVLGTQTEETTLVPEDLYQEGDYLAGTLAPKNWKALSDRRVPWPKDLDPKLALHEMAPFLAYRLNLEEAQARGRSIDQFIEAHEAV